MSCSTLRFNLLEDQDWYKRRDRLQKPDLPVSVRLQSGSLQDVPLRLVAVFESGVEKPMQGRILSSEGATLKIQAVNGSGDTLLCTVEDTLC